MKTICIYHSVDLDGWMSAAIVRLWHEQKTNNTSIDLDKVENSISPTKNIIHGEEENLLCFKGYTYGDKVPDVSEYDNIIMCDISFLKSVMEHLHDNEHKTVTWIDHHESAINSSKVFKRYDDLKGIRNTNFAACELTWQYYFPNEPMPEIIRLLGRYDCFGHKGTDEEQKVLEFQYGARCKITNYKEAYNYLIKDINRYITQDITQDINQIILQLGRGVYIHLCEEAKLIYKRKIDVKFQEPIRGQGGQLLNIEVRRFAVINATRFNPINFNIDYHTEGYDGVACFWYEKDKWNFSLYNDNGKVNVSSIALTFGGSGHRGAAGFIVDELKNIINIDTRYES